MDKVVHFEIPYDDKGRASKFYSEIFGWKLLEIPEMDYTMMDDSVGRRVAQLLSKPGIDKEIILHRPVCMRSYSPR